MALMPSFKIEVPKPAAAAITPAITTPGIAEPRADQRAAKSAQSGTADAGAVTQTAYW